MFFDLGTYAPVVALLLIAVVFAAFVSERWPAHVVAFIGAAVALTLGLVTTDDVLTAISNPAPATIAAMFILSAALVRTGALELLVGILKNSPPAVRSSLYSVFSPQRLWPRRF